MRSETFITLDGQEIIVCCCGEWVTIKRTDAPRLAEAIETKIKELNNADSSPVDCCLAPWRRMTPEEYARNFSSFPPHRAVVEMTVKDDPASAEVSVFLQ